MDNLTSPNPGKERNRQHPTHKETKKQYIYEHRPKFKAQQENQLAKEVIKSNRISQGTLYYCISQVPKLLYIYILYIYTLKVQMKNKQQLDLTCL